MIDLNANGIVLRGVDLIIFDKDGTLFQLYPFWSRLTAGRAERIRRRVGAGVELREELILKLGVDVAHGRIFREGPTGVQSRRYIVELALQFTRAAGYPMTREEIVAAFDEADEDIGLAPAPSSGLVPVEGMAPFLFSLKGRCRCAVFSGDITSRLEKTAELFGIRDCFQMVLGGDRQKTPKPDPWGVLEIMRALEVAPERTVMVGDSTFDIESGRRAGCRYLVTMVSDVTDLETARLQSSAVLTDFNQVTALPEMTGGR